MNVKPTKIIATVALGVASLASGLAQAQAQLPQTTTPAPAAGAAAQPPIASPAIETYLLGTGDIIEISIVGGAEGPMRVQIQSDGTILLPLIGTVQAGGKTVLQLRNLISDKLKSGGFYATPAVNVAVISYTSRYITVLGEVNRPGPVAIEREYRVSDILARVGGVKDASVKIIKLRREDGTELTLDVSSIAAGGPEDDPIIKAGDKLYVPTAQTFYVLGQVGRPGTYPVEDGMTLRKALAVAGGLTQLGSKKKVKVIRDGEEMKKYDLDAPIEIGDVIEVGERFF